MGGRIRTDISSVSAKINLIIAASLLCAGEVGIEPTTHGLTVRCANQLRYSPIKQETIFVESNHLF